MDNRIIITDDGTTMEVSWPGGRGERPSALIDSHSDKAAALRFIVRQIKEDAR